MNIIVPPRSGWTDLPASSHSDITEHKRVRTTTDASVGILESCEALNEDMEIQPLNILGEADNENEFEVLHSSVYSLENDEESGTLGELIKTPFDASGDILNILASSKPTTRVELPLSSSKLNQRDAKMMTMDDVRDAFETSVKDTVGTIKKLTTDIGHKAAEKFSSGHNIVPDMITFTGLPNNHMSQLVFSQFESDRAVTISKKQFKDVSASIDETRFEEFDTTRPMTSSPHDLKDDVKLAKFQERLTLDVSGIVDLEHEFLHTRDEIGWEQQVLFEDPSNIKMLKDLLLDFGYEPLDGDGLAIIISVGTATTQVYSQQRLLGHFLIGTDDLLKDPALIEDLFKGIESVKREHIPWIFVGAITNFVKQVVLLNSEESPKKISELVEADAKIPKEVEQRQQVLETIVETARRYKSPQPCLLLSKRSDRLKHTWLDAKAKDFVQGQYILLLGGNTLSLYFFDGDQSVQIKFNRRIMVDQSKFIREMLSQQYDASQTYYDIVKFIKHEVYTHAVGNKVKGNKRGLYSCKVYQTGMARQQHFFGSCHAQNHIIPIFQMSQDVKLLDYQHELSRSMGRRIELHHEFVGQYNETLWEAEAFFGNQKNVTLLTDLLRRFNWTPNPDDGVAVVVNVGTTSVKAYSQTRLIGHFLIGTEAILRKPSLANQVLKAIVASIKPARVPIIFVNSISYLVKKSVNINDPSEIVGNFVDKMAKNYPSILAVLKALAIEAKKLAEPCIVWSHDGEMPKKFKTSWMDSVFKDIELNGIRTVGTLEGAEAEISPRSTGDHGEKVATQNLLASDEVPMSKGSYVVELEGSGPTLYFLEYDGKFGAVKLTKDTCLKKRQEAFVEDMKLRKFEKNKEFQQISKLIQREVELHAQQNNVAPNDNGKFVVQVFQTGLARQQHYIGHIEEHTEMTPMSKLLDVSKEMGGDQKGKSSGGGQDKHLIDYQAELSRRLSGIEVKHEFLDQRTETLCEAQALFDKPENTRIIAALLSRFGAQKGQNPLAAGGISSSAESDLDNSECIVVSIGTSSIQAYSVSKVIGSFLVGLEAMTTDPTLAGSMVTQICKQAQDKKLTVPVVLINAIGFCVKESVDLNDKSTTDERIQEVLERKDKKKKVDYPEVIIESRFKIIKELREAVRNFQYPCPVIIRAKSEDSKSNKLNNDWLEVKGKELAQEYPLQGVYIVDFGGGGPSLAFFDGVKSTDMASERCLLNKQESFILDMIDRKYDESEIFKKVVVFLRAQIEEHAASHHVTRKILRIYQTGMARQQHFMGFFFPVATMKTFEDDDVASMFAAPPPDALRGEFLYKSIENGNTLKAGYSDFKTASYALSKLAVGICSNTKDWLNISLKKVSKVEPKTRIFPSGFLSEGCLVTTKDLIYEFQFMDECDSVGFLRELTAHTQKLLLLNQDESSPSGTVNHSNTSFVRWMDTIEKQMDRVFDGKKVQVDLEEDPPDIIEMRIQTMEGMVESIPVATPFGNKGQKTAMYLTNQQANKINDNEQALMKCIERLDLGDPKLLIIINRSLAVKSLMEKSHRELVNTPASHFNCDGYHLLPSEISEEDAKIVEAQMILFMRNTILPLARTNRAVILISGMDDCYLSEILMNVVLSEQERFADKCPFKVVAIVEESAVHYKAAFDPTAGSTMEIARNLPAWRRRVKGINKALKRCWPNDKLMQCNINLSASSVLIFEGLEMTKEESDDGSIRYEYALNAGPMKTFRSKFIEYWTKTRGTPAIAFQSFMSDSFQTGTAVSDFSEIVDLVERQIHVLLLDSRERFLSSHRLYEGLTQLAKESNAFPTALLVCLCDDIVNSEISESGKRDFLRVARTMLENHWEILGKYDIIDHYDISTLAYVHSAISIGGGPEGQDGTVPLCHRIQELESRLKLNKDGDHTKALLAGIAIDELYGYIDKVYAAAKQKVIRKWVEQHTPCTPELNNLMMEAQKLLKDSSHSNGKKEEVWRRSRLMDILTNKYTHSGSIHDIDNLKDTISKLTKDDKISENSLVALKLIKDAWRFFYIYNAAARVYKVISVVTFRLGLLVGMGITLLTVLIAVPAFTVAIDTRYAILFLSFLGTALSAVISHLNPAVRWQQLRMSALQIESEIWKFRTRSGEYRLFDGDPQGTAGPDGRFREKIAKIKKSILDMADLKNSNMYSQIKVETTGRAKASFLSRAFSRIRKLIPFGDSQIVPTPSRMGVSDPASLAPVVVEACGSYCPHCSKTVVSPPIILFNILSDLVTLRWLRKSAIDFANYLSLRSLMGMETALKEQRIKDILLKMERFCVSQKDTAETTLFENDALTARDYANNSVRSMKGLLASSSKLEMSPYDSMRPESPSSKGTIASVADQAKHVAAEGIGRVKFAVDDIETQAKYALKGAQQDLKSAGFEMIGHLGHGLEKALEESKEAPMDDLDGVSVDKLNTLGGTLVEGICMKVKQYMHQTRNIFNTKKHELSEIGRWEESPLYKEFESLEHFFKEVDAASVDGSKEFPFMIYLQTDYLREATNRGLLGRVNMTVETGSGNCELKLGSITNDSLFHFKLSGTKLKLTPHELQDFDYHLGLLCSEIKSSLQRLSLKCQKDLTSFAKKSLVSQYESQKIQTYSYKLIQKSLNVFASKHMKEIQAALKSIADDFDLICGLQAEKSKNRAEKEVVASLPMLGAAKQMVTSDDELHGDYSAATLGYYMQYRLQKACDYYKTKIPVCNRQRHIGQGLVFLGTIASGALAYFQFAQFASIASMLTATTTAWLEFQGTNSKISRYSSLVHALQDVVVHYDSLSPVDRVNVNVIDELVGHCESLLASEVKAWKSTSQASKMLQKQTDGGKGEKAKEETAADKEDKSD